jgi:hypothetical protein
MKLEPKKRVAKEYIILISCIGAGVLVFLLLTIYGGIIHSKIDNNYEEILKRREVISKYFNEETWNRLQELNNKDSIRNRWNNKWIENGLKNTFIKLGFNTPDQLIVFINKHSTIELELEKEKFINKKYYFSSAEEKIEFSFYLFLIIFSIVFPVRYLFYSIRFSIKLLRNK